MTYTPWQKWTDIYDVDKAFCVGTIFAELNKPFEGGRCR
ncbi:MAG: spore coat associated protein CotJA [Lachnospiraceae bacterium]|nr:spore coat associated protein CotJA [Lachnospiraceae bacterium]MDD6858611.1 spore coat associated protein CotJA [Lachnospiraceae bacterium]